MGICSTGQVRVDRLTQTIEPAWTSQFIYWPQSPNGKEKQFLSARRKQWQPQKHGVRNLLRHGIIIGMGVKGDGPLAHTRAGKKRRLSMQEERMLPIGMLLR